MAVGGVLKGVKDKVQGVYEWFFYQNRKQAPAPQMQEGQYPVQEQAAPSPQEQWQYQQGYAAPNAYQGQAAYQQPAPQGVYQTQIYPQRTASPSGYYQQPAPQQPDQTVPQQAQTAQQNRFRRSQQHAEQRGQIVNFRAYQQKNPAGAQMQQAGCQPAPDAYETDAQQESSLLSARVINARGIGDCRSAITLLRNGDAVVIVMEGISDAGEMRRMVDMLSGACYSLTATITKVSRHGVYLLAPQTLAVFADQATNAMNSAPVRAQNRGPAPVFTGQRVSYAAPQPAPQPVQQPVEQQPNAYAAPQGFTQRSVMQQVAPQRFYQRPAPQEAQAPAFSVQPAGYGYTPDESTAVDM